ncbi:MAG: hypothetical protein FWD61_06140 [Phycisphaerales bacterium]|nr:hypothetical protein [Phycisphaerales bacterium]
MWRNIFGRKYQMVVVVACGLISDVMTAYGNEKATPATQAATEPKAADAVTDRDREVQQLRDAIASKADDPENIRREFQIGVLLSQRPEVQRHPTVDMPKALEVFEAIVACYDHQHYYQSEICNSLNDSQYLVPQSAILAASIINGLNKGPEKAREYLHKAMTDLQWTYEKRKKDWVEAPKPEITPKQLMYERKERLEDHVKRWEQHVQDGKAGKVFGSLEMCLVEAAVRQYGLSFGPQHPDKVAAAMAEIIRDFPDTPMAEVAKKRIDAAQRVMGNTSTTRPAPRAAGKPAG